MPMADDTKRRAPKLDAAREMMREEIKPLREDVAKLPRAKGAQVWPLAILIVLLAAVGGYAAKVLYDRQKTRAAELAETFNQFSRSFDDLTGAINDLPTKQDLAKFDAKFDDQANQIQQMNAGLLAVMHSLKSDVHARDDALNQELSRASQAALKLEKGAATMVEMIEPIADQALQDINDARVR